MFTYPDINPIAIQIGFVTIYWYGLMYLGGFASAWLLARYRAPKSWSKEAVADIIFYAALGVVIGGRLGYVLFYNFSAYGQDPLGVFKLWDGGMSFHGGLVGVLAALWVFSRRYKLRYLHVTDFAAPLVPIGLALGRLGNFINGELWGRVTTVSWGMVFPHVDGQSRHPSQLYEFALEGVSLFIILWLYSAKTRELGRVSGLFLILYACIRIFVELFREPDAHLGLYFNLLSMGQLLSLPMLVLGFWLYFRRQVCNNI